VRACRGFRGQGLPPGDCWEPAPLKRLTLDPFAWGPKAGMGPVPLGTAGMGPSLRSEGLTWDPFRQAGSWAWGPHSPAQTSARYARWREGLVEPLKQVSSKMPSSIQNRGPTRRASAEAAYDRTEAKLTLRDSRSPSAPNAARYWGLR